jgi:hypothetical protein
MDNKEILDKILLVIKLEKMINIKSKQNISIKNIRDKLLQLNNEPIYINCISKLNIHEINKILNYSDNDKIYEFLIQDIRDKIVQLNNDIIYTNYISKLRGEEKEILKMNDDKLLENILKNTKISPDYSMISASPQIYLSLIK